MHTDFIQTINIEIYEIEMKKYLSRKKMSVFRLNLKKLVLLISKTYLFYNKYLKEINYFKLNM